MHDPTPERMGSCDRRGCHRRLRFGFDRAGSAARTLSISASPRQIPPPAGADFVAAFDLAYGAGARGQLIAATWKELEPTSGALNVSSLVRQLDYVPGRMPTIYVGIQLINTVAKEVPADLADTAFNAPVMRARFHTLIDRIAGAMPAPSHATSRSATRSTDISRRRISGRSIERSTRTRSTTRTRKFRVYEWE